MRRADLTSKGVLLSVCIIKCVQVQEPFTPTMSRWNKVRIRKKDRKQEIYCHQPLAIDLLCTPVRFEIFLPDTQVKYSILPLLQNQMYREKTLCTLRVVNFPSFHGFVDKYRKCMIYVHAIDRYSFGIQF
jgi:hypothetical protein